MNHFCELSEKEQIAIIAEVSEIICQCSELEDEQTQPELEKRLNEFWNNQKCKVTDKFFDTDTYGEYWDDYFEVDRAGLLEHLHEISKDNLLNPDEVDSITEDHKSNR